MTPVHLYASTFSTLELTRSMKQALPVHAKAAGRVSDIGRSVARQKLTTYPIHASMCWKTRELLPGRAARVSRRKTAKWLPAAT